MADPENIIPFAEGAPADDLMIEELADGDVLDWRSRAGYAWMSWMTHSST